MPLYEYECSKCGVFTVLQKVGEKAVKCDPDCAQKGCPKNAKKLVSASSFHLKGNGWYKTDYTSSSSEGSGKKRKKKDSSDTSSSDTASKDSGSKDAAETPKPKAHSCGSGCGC